MKKLTKATIAAAAGVALLLGTGGTLAYWNTTAPLGANTTITAGNLEVKPGASSAWTLTRGSAAPVTVDPATLRIVPGDKLTFTTTFDIVAEGRNLSMEAGVTPGSIAAATASDVADVALAAYLDANKTGTITVGTATPVDITGAPVAIPASGSDAVRTIPVSVTYTLVFPYSDTVAGAENAAKTGQVNLSQFSVTVRQTANGA
ncbi:alternate-type signal peptide domain-containing protein [Microbacterium gorillae]|uniref:alternate-type signal peptide domain-containing protein n=1 Tax=Microbacterium gorillae TaxID=1231063 RepID=UPI00059068FC|nr:alternate-type signal peptide domain-containing protein [Microbacterium gorillae]